MSANNVVAIYEAMVDEVVTAFPVPELQERYSVIESMNESYFQRTGVNLPSHLLSIFSDWILIEMLKDKDVDKVANTEFAILSPRQLRRRDKRENSVLSEVLDYLDLRYVRGQDSLNKKTKKTSEQ